MTEDSTQATPPNVEIEQSLELASAGDKQAALRFFEQVLLGPLFVPTRSQEKTLSFVPQYPNSLLDILGIQDGERVIVPCFSRPELIEEWFGDPLLLRSFTGRNLIEILPEDWWLCLNPGIGVEKEFSPWEISQLKLGPSAFPEMLEEIFGEEIHTLQVRKIADSDYAELKQALLEFGQQNKSIVRLFILGEEGVSEDRSEPILTILVGAEIFAGSQQEADKLSLEIERLAKSKVLGGDKVRVFVGKDSEDNVMLGIFGGIEPIFNRTSGTKKTIAPFSGLRKLFR